MQDIMDPALVSKINCFINRKNRQYPELRIKSRWNGYEYVPRRKWVDEEDNDSRAYVRERMENVWAL